MRCHLLKIDTRTKFLMLLISVVLSFQTLHADSPVTSCYFAESYMDKKMVRQGVETSLMTKKIAKYLLSAKSTMDVKAAVINALGWAKAGMDNTRFLQSYIAKKHKVESFDNISISNLTATEALCVGYMMILDDYFQPDPSLPYLLHAVSLLPKSFTVNMIYTIALCQQAMLNNEWCKVWTITSDFISNKTLEMDIRQGAWDQVLSYLGIYESECR